SALGLNLADWLRASPYGQNEARCRSVILLWLWGGPSHHETFDPKPEAVSAVRGPFRPIATRTPGLRIGELLPELANLSNMYAVIRSMAHGRAGSQDKVHALEFNGQTDYVTCGMDPSLHLAGPLAITVWVHVSNDQKNHHYVVCKHGWNIYIGHDRVPG